MGVRGRKPKHPDLEVLDGGRGKKAAPPEVESPTAYPEMTEGFEHAELWKQLRVVFEENGTPIRSSDVFAIEELCDLVASVRYLRKRVANQHTVAGDRNKNAIKSHPMPFSTPPASPGIRWELPTRAGPLSCRDRRQLPLGRDVSASFL